MFLVNIGNLWNIDLQKTVISYGFWQLLISGRIDLLCIGLVHQKMHTLKETLRRFRPYVKMSNRSPLSSIFVGC